MAAPKGGVGKTTVAVNLAVELARSHPDDVVLVDLDLVCGEVDSLLHIEATSSIAALTRQGSTTNLTTLKLSLSSHPSGVLVLPAPTSLLEADSVDPDALAAVLEQLRATFRYVVIDTGAGSTEASVVGIEAATELLLIATADLGGLRAMERHLGALNQLGTLRANRHLVLNRNGRKTGVDQAAVEAIVTLPVAIAIPEAKEFPLCANRGTAMVESHPRSPAARSLGQLAGLVAGDEVAAPARRSSWLRAS